MHTAPWRCYMCLNCLHQCFERLLHCYWIPPQFLTEEKVWLLPAFVRIATASQIPMKPDLDKYLPLIEHFDLSDDQKIELLNSIWQAMEGFSDSAFGDDPVQLVLLLSKDAIPSLDVLELQANLKTNDISADFDSATIKDS